MGVRAMTDWVDDATPPVSWIPTSGDVAAFIYARTNHRVAPAYGVSVDQPIPADETALNDFTADTNPSKARVDRLIAISAPRVGVIVGAPCKAGPVAELATLALILRVCASSEIGGFIRQSNAGESAYKALKEEADEVAKELRMLADQQGSGNEPGPADDAGLMAGCFPPSPLSVVGYDGYVRPRAL